MRIIMIAALALAITGCASNVVTEVMTVRAKVSFTDLLSKSTNGIDRYLCRFSLTRS